MKRLILLFCLLCPSAFASIPYVISPLSDGTAVVSISNRATLYVDPNGNDSTAKRGIRDRPWATLGAAKLAAQVSDWIIVMPGNYTNNNLLGANWFFMPGASVLWTNTGALDSHGIFDDRDHAYTNSIAGYGDFRVDGFTNGGHDGVIVLTNPLSQLNFKGHSLSFSTFQDPTQQPNPRQHAAVHIENCQPSFITVDEIVSPMNGQFISALRLDDFLVPLTNAEASSSIYWRLGEVHIACPHIGQTTNSSYAVWGELKTGGNNPQNLWLTANWIQGNIYFQSTAASINNPSWRSWIDAKQITGYLAYYDTGKHYLRAEKVDCLQDVPAITSLGSGTTTNVQVWLNIQKVSCSNDFLYIYTNSQTWANVEQFDDTGSKSNKAIVHEFGGELHLRNGQGKLNAGFGVYKTGGTLSIDGGLIDTSSGIYWPIYVTDTNSPILSDVRLIAPTGSNVVSGGGALVGQWSDGPNMVTTLTNFANGAGITNLPLSALSRSSAVSGQVAEWNGSSWVPADIQGVTIPNTITPTNFILNQKYTNNSGSVQFVDATISLTTAAVAGQSSISLYADQAGGIGFAIQDQAKVTTLITGLAVTDYRNLIGALSNNAAYYFTNDSTGAGNSSAIVSGSGELITLGDGAAAGVATLSGNNTFVGANTFGALSRMASLYVTNGFTNEGLTANTAIISDANKKEISLANGGSTTVLYGTTPPTYSTAPGYALALFSAGNANMNTSTTYYFGGDPNTGTSSVETNNTLEIPRTGHIKRVFIKIRVAGTLGTGEAVTHSIRNNTTSTDYSCGTMAYSTAEQHSSTVLNQAVTQGDMVSFKVVAPGWATSPTSVRPYVVVYIED